MGNPNPTFRPGTRQRMTSENAGDLTEVIPACPPEAYFTPPADPRIDTIVKEEDAKVLAAINKAAAEVPVQTPAETSAAFDKLLERKVEGYPIVLPAQE